MGISRSESNRKYRETHQEKIRQYALTYRQAHKEEAAQYRNQYYSKLENITNKTKYDKQYYKNNKENIANYRKEYRKNNHETILKQERENNKKDQNKIRRKQYYEKNKIKIAEKAKQYYIKNKKVLLEYNKKYCEDYHKKQKQEMYEDIIKQLPILNTNLNENQKIYFTYIIEFQDNIKIGYSNNIEYRISQINRNLNQQPINIWLYCSNKSSDCGKMEIYLQTKYKQYNILLNKKINGYTEFFNKECLSLILKYMKQYKGFIKYANNDPTESLIQVNPVKCIPTTDVTITKGNASK